MMSLREKDTPYAAKQEVGESTKTTSSSSRQWSGLKNPRIVRVSRTFGGKDRHSKVCTIKGLRDRRIRLSVPTAIQLYDLQDRLGLNQPSKVIDWLLDTTKHDIDKLPPLPSVPGGFAQFHQATLTSQGYVEGPQSSSTSFLDANLLPFRKEGININSQGIDVNEDGQSLAAKLKYWDSNVVARSKQKGVDHQAGTVEDNNTSHVSAQNFFPVASGNSSILPHSTLLNNNNMFNYYQWEPSNLSLTQLGNHDMPSQNDHHQTNSSTLPSSLSLSSGCQLCLYPSMATTPLLHPHVSFMNTHHQQEDNELRQFNRFHFSNPISSSLHNSTTLGSKLFPWSMSHQTHLHQNDESTPSRQG